MRERTEAGKAKQRLMFAWFEANPNQPMPEGRRIVEKMFAAIESEAVASVEEAVGPKRYPQAGQIRAQLIFNDGWNDMRDVVLRFIVSHQKIDGEKEVP